MNRYGPLHHWRRGRFAEAPLPVSRCRQAEPWPVTAPRILWRASVSPDFAEALEQIERDNDAAKLLEEIEE